MKYFQCINQKRVFKSKVSKLKGKEESLKGYRMIITKLKKVLIIMSAYSKRKKKLLTRLISFYK